MYKRQGLVEPADLVMRKTGFSAVAAGNLLEILAKHGWDLSLIHISEPTRPY